MPAQLAHLPHTGHFISEREKEPEAGVKKSSIVRGSMHSREGPATAQMWSTTDLGQLVMFVWSPPFCLFSEVGAHSAGALSMLFK